MDRGPHPRRSPEEVAAKIDSFSDGGADCVALFPMPRNEVDRMVQPTARQVLAQLKPGC